MSVECQWLVDKQRFVHGHTEKNLCGRQAIDFRGPDVQRNPDLGKEPQQPHPRMLPKHMFINITQRHKHWLQWYLRIRQNVGMHEDQVKGENEIRLNTESLMRETVASLSLTSGLVSCVKHANQSVSRARTWLRSPALIGSRIWVRLTCWYIYGADWQR